MTFIDSFATLIYINTLMIIENSKTFSWISNVKCYDTEPHAKEHAGIDLWSIFFNF